MRLYGFLTFAWPIIVISSVILACFSAVGMDHLINRFLSPLTEGVLNLPASTGITLFLGIFRKELTLLMLTTALGVQDISTVLSNQQILVLVVFTVLYVPCVATISMLWREGGWRIAFLSIGLNTLVSLLIAGVLAHLAIII